ncbi:Elongation factor P [Candidatus Hartigia pinicola]|nr:Elongation factor P [Candidatus Hartigia pinicola]
MAIYSINEFRPGLKIILDCEPCVILDSEFVKPGKGQAFSRVRLRKLTSNQLLEKTFKSIDAIEGAEDVIDMNLIYLYNHSTFWYFMHNETFEQFSADEKAVGDKAKWLIEQSQCILTLWNSRPISVTPPNFVELKIIETDPGLKGDTTGSGSKPATLSNSAIVKVPLFVQIGEVIKVDTRSGVYVSRVK